ncbi:hypothetical protein [Streptomyces cyaneofuscatus]|uniref:hypothetical protein n=1 Tax=Streptomyces cyaneofuscatus TaxID=66883 RepID=UPI00331A0B25
MAEQPELVSPLSTVVDMVENDEAELALDDIGMVIKFSRFPVLRSEYEDLLRAAQQLDSLDSLTDTGVELLIVEG